MSLASTEHPAGNTPLVTENRDGTVAFLTLDNPVARNALSVAMMSALSGAIARVDADPQVRVVVLRGEGPVFCAGHDLKELLAHKGDADGGQAFFSQLFTQSSEIMQSIVSSPKPFIAEIDGVATAAGCQLVASCDLAYASATSRFATPGVNIGLFCSTPMVALSRNVSRKHAMEMLLTGEMVSADDAVRIGLINRALPEGGVHSEVMRVANRIAAQSSLVIKIGKQAFYRQLEEGLAGAYALTAKTMTENMLSRDAGEGAAAFFDKRKPDWEDQ